MRCALLVLAACGSPAAARTPSSPVLVDNHPVWTWGEPGGAPCPFRDPVWGPVHFATHRTLPCHARNPEQQLQLAVQRDERIATCLSSLDGPSSADVEVEVEGKRVASMRATWRGDAKITLCARLLASIVVDDRPCSWRTQVTLERTSRSD